VLASYNQEQSESRVKPETMPGDLATIKTAAAGTPPDVMYLTWTFFADLLDPPLTLRLDDSRRGARPPDVWAYSFTRQEHIRWHRFGGTDGATFVNADAAKVTIADQAGVQTTQWLVDRRT
jgi:hypothetical protein